MSREPPHISTTGGTPSCESLFFSSLLSQPLYERLDLGLDVWQSRRIEPIVQNVGLPNGFLAAGLIWRRFAGPMTFPIRV